MDIHNALMYNRKVNGGYPQNKEDHEVRIIAVKLVDISIIHIVAIRIVNLLNSNYFCLQFDLWVSIICIVDIHHERELLTSNFK
jgi:hypothetical protein